MTDVFYPFSNIWLPDQFVFQESSLSKWLLQVYLHKTNKRVINSESGNITRKKIYTFLPVQRPWKLLQAYEWTGIISW